VLPFALVLAIAAARGLRTLRPWALTAQKAMFVFQGTHLVLAFSYDLSKDDWVSAIAGLGLLTALLLPTAVLAWTEPIAVFSAEYERAIAATPHITVPAKLPLALKFAMACLVAACIALAFGTAGSSQGPGGPSSSQLDSDRVSMYTDSA
jgi:hypothetical protein